MTLLSQLFYRRTLALPVKIAPKDFSHSSSIQYIAHEVAHQFGVIWAGLGEIVSTLEYRMCVVFNLMANCIIRWLSKLLLSLSSLLLGPEADRNVMGSHHLMMPFLSEIRLCLTMKVTD